MEEHAREVRRYLDGQIVPARGAVRQGLRGSSFAWSHVCVPQVVRDEVDERDDGEETKDLQTLLIGRHQDAG